MDQVGNVEVKGSALPQTGWAESYFILMGRRTEVGYTSRRACGFSGGKVGSPSLVIFSPQGCAGRLVRGGQEQPGLWQGNSFGERGRRTALLLRKSGDHCI